MKRLISAVLAMSLLGATAASAAPFNHGTPIQYRGDSHRDNNGAAIAAGIGFIALAAILASNHRDYDRGWDHRDYRYDRGYGNDYRGYDRGYDHRGW